MILKTEGNKPGFVLSTKHTTYAFFVNETGQLEHVYYGAKVKMQNPADYREQQSSEPGNCIAYSAESKVSLENLCLETSGVGKGDVREPFVEVTCADGSTTTDFVYENCIIRKGKDTMETLPSSYDETDSCDHLCILMKDKNHGFQMELHYYVFEEEDVITRRTKFLNTSESPVELRRLLSMQLDLNERDLTVSTFVGHWIKEMEKRDVKLSAGKFVISSTSGVTSNRANSFFMVSREGCNETAGECYGFHLVYSGNHYEAVEVSSFDKTRIVNGINPATFTFHLDAGDSFEAPEAVMTFSAAGHTGMSHNLHRFIRQHIVRGYWKDKERPVLLNSWEANYFDIDESKLLNLARKGKEVGIELFVMDDGWFGERSDDKRALGDWTENAKKLPGGLKGLAEKINALGLEFGVWVEPEMVNVDSDLYRAHPDWAVDIPGMHHSEGRTQRLLDLANPEVVDHMIEQMTKVFSSGNISYVKWDMNRIFSDYYSKYLPAERQMEFAHRYVCGLYRMMGTLVERFPQILFEGCASGGCRFDLGILSYFPQIWGSDNSDAISRLSIQNGYSYGYPMSTVTAHVSAVPNHQTLRRTPIGTRFNVACFGVLGYECNLCDMKKEDVDAIKEQIALYKKYRKTLQYGDFYRLQEGNVYQWSCVDSDQNTAVTMFLQKHVEANKFYNKLLVRGLDDEKQYHLYSLPFKHNLKIFGDLINTVTPVHVKQDGIVHNVISKVTSLPGEVEDIHASGSLLNYKGFDLKQSFASTGFNENVRVMTEYASRLYFIEAES